MQAIVNDIFYSIYQYFGFGIVFAVITMIALPEIKRKGIKMSMKGMRDALKSDKNYRNCFFFFIYFFMVLSRTLICRNIWQCPWENIIGEWGLYTSEGEINLEGLENLVLFIPLATFGLFSEFRILAGLSSWQLFKFVLKGSFLFTLFIECCQLFLRLGTFQLSDIAQNTAGGAIGWGIHWGAKKIQKRRKLHNENN